MSTAVIYLRLVGAQIRAQASYRRSFVIDLLSQAALALVEISTVAIFFGVTRSIGGFTLAPAMLISALAQTCFRLGDLVGGGMDNMAELVRRGRIDAQLVRPMSALGQIFVNTLEVRVFGGVAQGMIVLGIALAFNDIAWSPVKVLLLLVTLVSGMVSVSAIFVAGGTLTFWIIDSRPISDAFTYGGRDFITYPITIYGPVFRTLFAFVLPFAFVAYYPALALLDRPDPLGLPAWLGYCSPVAAAVLALAATAFWRVGIRHYRGTGS
ncbi:ABC transporter permease [Fodinicola acaciae]|uniref:ABC transporter permease n=1 Tax=Fodinicola acaciae TaxID=2681555 RepID=UPI0013D0F7AE|nr:ABC-2 family transporter protein [Fodinicola acaciae]